MKLTKLPFIACSTAMVFSACGDSNSTGATDEDISSSTSGTVSESTVETPDIIVKRH